MAEVASSLGASSQSSTESALDMPDAEKLLLSPSVKEAMDRILPRSASHLLQQRLSLDDVDSQCGRMSFEVRENGNTLNHKSHLPSERDDIKKTGLKKRISRADLEIITAGDADVASSERVSRKYSVEKTNDCPPKTHSDSDDVSRPFAAVREKKKEKRKKKKKRVEVTSEEQVNSVGESEDDFVSFKEKKSEISLTNSDLPLSDIGMAPKSSNRILTNGGGFQDLAENDSLPSSLTGDESKHNLKDFGSQQNSSVCDDMSNNSFSSTKENVEHRRRLECQKLPKVKLNFYNIVRHKNKIKKTFPPSFVVIEQISALLSHANEKSVHLANASNEVSSTVLPLSVRLKYLSTTCAKGMITCRKNKKDKNPIEPKHQVVLDNIHIPDSEDDFEVVRGGRSLRKRDKTICYVEPTEADLFVEYNQKRSRSKAKESAEVDEDPCSKKRKLNSQAEPAMPLDKSGSAIDDKNYNQECANEMSGGSKSDKTVLHDYAKAKPPPTSGPKEVVVYPKKPTKDSSNKSSKSKTVDKRAASVTVSTSSALPGQSVLTSHTTPGLISTFSPFLTSMSSSSSSSGVLGASTVPRDAAISSLAASGIVRPQFCMVKMDGKDVLLPVLPSPSGSGPQSATLFLPGGRRLVVPHNHQLSQQINQASRMVNSLPMSAMNMPFITPRPPELMLSTSTINGGASNSVNLSIPSISTPQSFSIRGIPNASLSQSTRAVYPPITTASQTTYAPVTSHRSLAPVAMAAPNSTTVVRNIRVPSSSLRAAVPNQAGGVRAVRIFVPGCQATGVPGRFATLGSLASNTSALTRLSASSDLLPQKKQTKDQLTPEQRAEKRRKLEKKYPLPPGVVIKTEPLDTPTQSTSTYSRSLLPGNIQVVSASRRPGMQSIRFLNPSSVASLGSSGIANFIVRAASGDGRQAILIPSSLGMLTTSASLSSAVATASSASVTPSSSSSAIIVTSASSLPGGTISILPTFTTALSNCSTTNTTSSGGATGLGTLLSTGSSSVREQRGSALSETSSSPSLSGSTSENVTKLKTEVETMRKLLVAQEAMGLRGDRIEKLKELLKKKEDALKVIAKSDNGADSSDVNTVGGNDVTEQSTTGQSVTEPIEID